MTRLSSIVQIGTAPDRAFALLRETRSWPNWWRSVSHARTADLRPLREGSDLDVTFAFGPIRLASKGRVHLLTDDRALAWRAPLGGVLIGRTFFVAPSPRGTRMELIADIPLPAAVLRWFRIETAWKRAWDRNLRGFKTLAERL